MPRISTPKRAWAPPGMRPKAPRQVIRESSYVYAAVAPEQGLMTSLILPRADTAMMNLFLAQVAQDFADYFIVMQVDQAGWHRAKDLRVPANMRLIFQPPYSPEVNPVEHRMARNCARNTCTIASFRPWMSCSRCCVKHSLS
jgi:DDE superfamily endonuclease